MPERILILGGTREAAELARQWVSEGHQVTTSLAGRTKEPKPLTGEVRVGGFGGVDGLAHYLIENCIDRLIDATHPFAKQISANAVAAAKQAGVVLDIRQRAPWQKVSGDDWIEVPSLKEAANAIPAHARVLLALGSQHLAPFHHRDDVFFLIRMVDAPTTPLPFKNHSLLLGRPQMTPQSEQEILKAHAITHIVCRNSGGSGAYAKIEAARLLALPVIIVTR
ncbi:MAG: cobalt-precorrin-6A reductase [Pseudomonadota bacterium]